MNWWEGFGLISAANCLEHISAPTALQVSAIAAPVAAPWSIVIRTSKPASSGRAWYGEVSEFDAIYAEYAVPDGLGVEPGLITPRQVIAGSTPVVIAIVHETGTSRMYFDGVLMLSHAATTTAIPVGFVWRGDTLGNTWPPAISHAAIYNVALSTLQLSALQRTLSPPSTTTTAAPMASSFTVQISEDALTWHTINGVAVAVRAAGGEATSGTAYTAQGLGAVVVDGGRVEPSTVEFRLVYQPAADGVWGFVRDAFDARTKLYARWANAAATTYDQRFYTANGAGSAAPAVVVACSLPEFDAESQSLALASFSLLSSRIMREVLTS